MGGIFGMHPSMGSLKPFYDAGDFGVVQAVGMAEPNRSHFQAMEEMERAAPGSSLRTGWLDRVLGLRPDGEPFQATQTRLEHRGERLPGTGAGARDVVDRLVRPGRRVERHGAEPLGHGAASA